LEQPSKFDYPMEKIKNLLLIEDNDITILITKKMVEQTGLVENIVIAKNGKDGYDYLTYCLDNKRSFPEVILLDIMMPIWDGWTFLEKTKEIQLLEKLNIYLYTSSVSDEDKHEASRYGLQDRYLVKPIEINVIEQIVAEVRIHKKVASSRMH